MSSDENHPLSDTIKKYTRPDFKALGSPHCWLMKAREYSTERISSACMTGSNLKPREVDKFDFE
jgi:hypothetical protein